MSDKGSTGSDTTALSEEEQISQLLKWIGFTEDQASAIIKEGFDCFDDIMVCTTSDISDLASSFQKRTVADGRINFGLKRTKRIKSLLQWTRDFRRINMEPNIDGLNERRFLNQLAIASQRHETRLAMKDAQELKAKEASPGPLKSEKQWNEWITALVNYLSTMVGQDGVPLSCVIREEADPDPDAVCDDFTQECIACAPLEGNAFDADKISVHQSIVSFTTGHPSEKWISSVSKHRDGRKDVDKLRAHFAGEGNASRRIADAEALKDTLHYTNERAMPFETFLTKCEEMFQIFKEQGEEMTEDSRIRFLLKKVQHAALQGSVESLKAQISLSDPGTVSYTTCANHLSKAVSDLPECRKGGRNISSVQKNDEEVSGSICRSDGTIKTGKFTNWSDLTPSERAKVAAERKRLGIPSPGGNGKGGKAGNLSKLNEFKKKANKYKRQAAALKKQVVKFNEDGKNNDDDDDDDTPEQDAGDQFGGRASKKGRKR